MRWFMDLSVMQRLFALCALFGGLLFVIRTLLMVEKIHEIVALQTEAIRNLKIDKITVWDGGAGEGKSSTANFVSGLIKSLPPLQDIAAMAGVELPAYLGKVADKAADASDAEHRSQEPDATA